MTHPAGAGGSGERLGVRIEAIRYAAQGIHLFEFRDPAGAPLPPFTPGAHIDVHLPNGLVRQYSIASPSRDRSRYVVGVKCAPQSRGGSRFLFEQARVADLIEIGAPRNHFELRENAPLSVFVAGGIGITPIVCMVRRLVELGREWRLHYAVRYRAEAAFLEELRGHGARLHLHVDKEVDGRPMDIAALVAAVPADAELYCCGPSPMLDAFEAAARSRPAERCHVERFAAQEAPATQGGFVVELARSGRRLAIPPGRTIAEVLRDAGVPVQLSCEQGICGACETRVLAGVPDHRDAILSEGEKAAGNVMMVCCSGSRSPTLVLDL